MVIPRFKRTPAGEAVAAPTNTAVTKSIFFIRKVRRPRQTKLRAKKRLLITFSLNKAFRRASWAQKPPLPAERLWFDREKVRIACQLSLARDLKPA
jgi:hypothetical protein